MEDIYREYTIGRIMENSQLASNGCLIWNGAKNKAGYGLISITLEIGKRFVTSAHRANYMAHHNILLNKKDYVMHKCDNPSCVNINHLCVGSPRENTQDMILKNRAAKKHKKHSRIRDLSDDKILAIRSAKGPLVDVAFMFGVSISYVSKLRNNKAKTLLVSQ